MFEVIANEAAFQIEVAWNPSRRNSGSARRRWWQGFAAFPSVYREVAGRHYEQMRERESQSRLEEAA
jgi:hypothetical protein